MEISNVVDDFVTGQLTSKIAKKPSHDEMAFLAHTLLNRSFLNVAERASAPRRLISLL
jgi:hypothetical protein